MIKKTFSLIVGIFMLSGCNGNYMEMSPQQLRDLVQGVQGSGSTAWRGTFYCGSDQSYDYFRHRRTMTADILVKVPKGSIALPKMIAFPASESEWIDMSQRLKGK